MSAPLPEDREWTSQKLMIVYIAGITRPPETGI